MFSETIGDSAIALSYYAIKERVKYKNFKFALERLDSELDKGIAAYSTNLSKGISFADIISRDNASKLFPVFKDPQREFTLERFKNLSKIVKGVLNGEEFSEEKLFLERDFLMDYKKFIEYRKGQKRFKDSGGCKGIDADSLVGETFQ